VFITGDFNCRTSNAKDFISFDRYLDIDPDIEPNVYNLTRANKDHVLDTHGKKLIHMCKNYKALNRKWPVR